MRYVSIDIETTGLDPEKHQILEIAAVADDLETPLAELPIFHCYLKHDPIIGSPVALDMNARLIKLLANTVDRKSTGFLTLNHVWSSFHEFLCRNGFSPSNGVVVAGKNVAGFDLPFLKKLPMMAVSIKFHHRVLDPAMLYLLPEDEVPPDLMECCDRAGLARPEGHQAVDDALTVVRLIRKGLADAE